MVRAKVNNATAKSPIAHVLASCRGALTTLGVASGVINILTLTGSIFMMQVYDRVLSSQSVPTLVGLSVLAIGAYMFQGWLEVLRSRILTLIGEKIDSEVSPLVHNAGVKLAVSSPTGAMEASQSIRDMEAVRGFVSGQGLVALFDLPWLPLYLLMATMLHPYLGLAIFVASLVLVWVTIKTERSSQEPSKKAFEANVRRNQQLEAGFRGAEAVVANGMRASLAERWGKSHQAYLQAQREATFVVTGYSVVSKSLRMMLQSFMLGLGAFLAIRGHISPGAIIAASILASRALAPIDQTIASWRPFTAARDGYRRLNAILQRIPAEPERFKLALPNKTLSVEQLAVAPPGVQKPAVVGVSFTLQAGQALGIVGTSASGKSSLVRALVNVWQPAAGRVRLDASPLDQWAQEDIGAAIGYLPQDFQLFDGTVAENISRFDPKATEEAVQEAAVAAGLDAYVRGVLGGYDAMIGPGGAFLSAGQRQRIGLARALYGRPFLVVLDEPNSNLDQDGETALQSAIRAVRQRGGIVIVVAHRQNVLNEVDLLLALAQGGVLAYGPREDVLAKLRTQQTKPLATVPAPVVDALAATKMGAAILKREPQAAGWVMVPPRIVKPGETRGQ